MYVKCPRQEIPREAGYCCLGLAAVAGREEAGITASEERICLCEENVLSQIFERVGKHGVLNTSQLDTLNQDGLWLGMVTHACNSGFWQPKQEMASLRPAWAT